jgi:hypothetical protein
MQEERKFMTGCLIIQLNHEVYRAYTLQAKAYLIVNNLTPGPTPLDLHLMINQGQDPHASKFRRGPLLYPDSPSLQWVRIVRWTLSSSIMVAIKVD